MADEAIATEVQTEKVLDISSGKMVDKPIEVKTEETTDPPKPADPVKPTEAASATPPAAEPAKPVEAAQPPVVAPDFNATLKEKYALDEDGLINLVEQNKTLAEKLKTAEATPTFSNEQDKAAYEFLKQYPPSRLGEGMKTYATILDMDPTKADEKTVLREAYIMSKPTIPRENAAKLFEADYKRKFVLDKEKFESDNEYQEQQELANIEKDERVAAARQTLSAKIAELKKTPEIKPEPKVEAPQLPPSAQQYSTAIDTVKMDKLTYTDPTNDKIQYHIAVPAERVKEAQEFAREYVKQHNLYDTNGKIPNFDQNKLVQMGLMMLDPDWFIGEHVKQVTNLSRTITAEQIAGTKPDKESKGLGEQGVQDYTTQFKNMGEKAKQEREQQQNRPRY